MLPTPGNTFYNIPSVVPLAFEVDEGVLRRVLQEIVRRHESLRTTFGTELNRPVQFIASEIEVPLAVTDLSDLPEEERRREARRLAAEELQTPFDLERGPLLRTALVRLERGSYLLLLTMHHIVSDAWSMGLFFWELWRQYEAFTTGATTELSALPVQYADFAEWRAEASAGHWGHLHRRRVHFSALMEVTPSEDAWKLAGLTVTDVRQEQ